MMLSDPMMMRRSSALAWVLLASACVNGTIKPLPPVQPSRIFNMPDHPVCETQLEAPTQAGTIDSADLVEASGLVASPTHPGVLWMMNDHGDTARVFAVSASGKDLGQLALPNTDNVDFEDIAAAPCPNLAGPCIYVADTGDNHLDRQNLVVYAFPEPDVDAEHPLASNSEASLVWRFPVAAPDGPLNIEAFVVLPDLSAMVFYEKSTVDAKILRYAAPWSSESLATLEVTGTFTAPGSTLTGENLVTGADVHPSGTRVAIRTYGAVYELKLDVANGLTADHWTADDLSLVFDGPADEPQGESVGYDDTGTGLFLVSESDTSPHQPLDHASCAAQ